MDNVFPSPEIPGVKKLIQYIQKFILVILVLSSGDLYAQSSPVSSCNLLTKVGGLTSVNGAEISAFHSGSNRVYSVAGSVIEYHIMTNTGALSSGGSLPLGFTLAAGDSAIPNSVAVHNNRLAASFAIINKTTRAQQPGRVTFYNATNGAVQKSVTVGYLPDMVTFTSDGKKLLTANEAEPNGYNQPDSFDPEGSISIVDLSAGMNNITVQNASFSSFNGQIAALRSAGVRIYGPNATVAQDLEPEYIAISPDGTTAWVTLQENNAFATVDIASATVTNIIPLGLKNHNRPTVLGLETFEFNNMPSLGNTAAGQSVPLGGFSGLAFEGYAANGNMKFITHTDRGPNGEPTGINRPFFLPNFAPEIVRFELSRSTGQISITQRIQLKRSAAQLLTGLPNTAISTDANLPYNDEVPVNLQNHIISPLDPLGADLEAIYVAADGSFWMVDEYRPAIYHFAPDGVLIKRFVPAGTAAAAGQPAGTFGEEKLPAVIGQRRQNRGFEAIAFQDGKLYAFVQSPIRNPASLSNTALNGMKNTRVIEFDPVTETTTGQYIYIMDNDPAVAGSATDTRADKIGDAIAIGNGEFLVVERDDDAIDSDPLSDIKKKIYRFSLAGATNVNALPNIINGKTLDQMTTAEMAAAAVTPISKSLHVDLATAGYNTVEKVEGLALVDRNTIVVLNDNDFTVAAVAIDPVTGLYTPNPNAEKPALGLIRIQNNGIDASDRDLTSSSGKINIKHWPLMGMYQPDAIAQYSINGQTYYITANEGDARDWPGFTEEIRVGAGGYVLDPVVFPNAGFLKNNANIGRLQLTSATGNLDGDTEFEQIQSLGARSFSIWNSNGQLVWDSGDELEQMTAALSPALFNSEGTASGFDSRSDNKGPEPEAVAVGLLNDVPYVFVGMERTGDIAVYNISDPLKPVIVQYINTAEELGVEGLIFVTADKSPTGKPLLIASAEVSKTVAVFEVNMPSISVSETSGLENNDAVICSGDPVTLTASGSAPYLWSTGATSQSITVSPTSTTTYSVTACSLTASQKVTVRQATPSSIYPVPENNIFTGGIPTNIYLGYGPKKITLFVSAHHSGIPFTYSWTGGPGLNNYTSAEPVFTATAPGSYTFTCTVTNKYGCTSTCSVTICVTDIRVPGTSNKVYLCHAGVGGSNPTTLAVSTSAVDNHLSVHGDKLGKCGETPCGESAARSSLDQFIVDVETPFSVKVLPNPSSTYFTLQVQSDLKELVEIRVTDLQGRRVYNTRGNAGSFRFGETLAGGIYLVEVIQGKQKQVLKLIKQ